MEHPLLREYGSPLGAAELDPAAQARVRYRTTKTPIRASTDGPIALVAKEGGRKGAFELPILRLSPSPNGFAALKVPDVLV
jgi:hypothetical protein